MSRLENARTNSGWAFSLDSRWLRPRNPDRAEPDHRSLPRGAWAGQVDGPASRAPAGPNRWPLSWSEPPELKTSTRARNREPVREPYVWVHGTDPSRLGDARSAGRDRIDANSSLCRRPSMPHRTDQGNRSSAPATGVSSLTGPQHHRSRERLATLPHDAARLQRPIEPASSPTRRHSRLRLRGGGRHRASPGDQ